MKFVVPRALALIQFCFCWYRPWHSAGRAGHWWLRFLHGEITLPKMIWSKWFLSQEVLRGNCIPQVLPQLMEDCAPQEIQGFTAWFLFSPYEILRAGFAFTRKFYVSIWSFTSSGDLPQLAEILQFLKFTFSVQFLPFFRWNSELVTMPFSARCLLTEGAAPWYQGQPLCAHFCQLIAIFWPLLPPPSPLCSAKAEIMKNTQVFFSLQSDREGQSLFCWLWQLQGTALSLQQVNADLSWCNKGHRRELFV